MRFAGWFMALVAIGLAGCGSGAGNTTKSPGDKEPLTRPGAKKSKYTITVIAKSSNNPVFQSALTGAKAAAKEIGEQERIGIDIDWQTPPVEDGQIQAQRINDAVARGVDAILISCSDAAKVNGAINDAVNAGVPVMTFDSDASDSKRFAFYGVDDLKTGQAVMTELAQQMGDKGVVAILAGNQNAPNLQKRVQGVKDEAAKHPGIKIVETFYHEESPQAAAAAVQKAMAAYPEITGWAMVGGWPLFTTTLLTELDPNKVKVVSVDALPAELEYVAKGIAPVLLAQPTYEWGHKGVEIVMNKLLNKGPVEMMNEMKLVRVSKENLSEWAQQLKDWGFDVDAKYLKPTK